MKKTIKELEEREKYLGKLYKIFLVIICVGIMFVVPSYFELHIIFNFLFIILVGFGVAGMFITLIQSYEIGKTIILINKENKPTKKIILYPYQDTIEELLKKEEGWIAELSDSQKDLAEKVIHLMEEDNKRKEGYIKAFEEMRKLLQELKK